MQGDRRRSFLKSLAGGFAITPALTANTVSGISRIEQSFRIRSTAAAYRFSEGEHPHPSNGDEQQYPSGAANYSKGLPHDFLGEPIKDCYSKFVAALSEGTFTALENIRLGGSLKLSNPLAENAYDLEGLDSRQFTIPQPPSFSSKEQAGEMAELYWQALIRDVPFSRWDHDATVGAAVADLGANGFVPVPPNPILSSPLNPRNIFRIPGKGVLEGPYVSQFLLLPVPNGSMLMDQRYYSAIPNQCFATDYSAWLALQNGETPAAKTQFEDNARYISTPRGLCEFVHRDYSFQAFLSPALILSGFGQDALTDSNPYKWSKTQAGFVTFGAPHVIDFMARAANASLKAAWFQKWLVHRRLRPEEFAARVNSNIAGQGKYPIHDSLRKSASLRVLDFAHGGHLLPQAYPEGCPAHPSYPAGHAVIAGACLTMLKAFFREDFVIPKPVVPDPNGNKLETYSGALTVGGELNKLAANVAMARDFAGLHWRSDSANGIRLGEAVAIGILRDSLGTVPEPFSGFDFTNFDGERVIIS